MEEIAISGVSGRFPKCDNVDEFRAALLSGEDLITDDHKRWPHAFLKTPPSLGILECWDLFDASFFSVNQKHVDEMDPRTRQILEVCFECILDAGINPLELRGSKTGVFLGATENFSNKGVMNRMTAVMANSISYALDLKAPSCAVDTGCSTSIYAMNQAVDAIKSGSCEAAIVCSAQNHLDPEDSIIMSKMGILSPEGRCKTFDRHRNGYVKAEAVVAVLLQKQMHARRIYATVAAIGCNVDGYKEGGMFSPSSESQIRLLKEVYQKYGIDPNDIEYVETHGTGTIMGDTKECEALARVFKINTRTIPLKIGSVKTIMGHSESAAGLVSLVKLLNIIQTDIIPRNLHFYRPADDIPEIIERKLEVVYKNTPYARKLLATSAFGIGGANGHLVLRPFYTKPIITPNNIVSNNPRLVLVSGRTLHAIELLLEAVRLHRNNNEFLSLIGRIFEKPIYNHSYRGYIILNSHIQEINRWTGEKRPIWFSYTGMGSQWPGMGRDLMRFEVFSSAIKKCSAALESYGMDLEDIVVNGTEEILEDPQNCFPAIIAVAVGLTDILYALGIKPDGIIGHSLGEIGCAYADGAVTAEQAVQIAYSRGFATKNTKLIPGLMASVGLGFDDCINMLPDDIYVACINSDANVTVSGPEKSIRTFVEQLDSRNIFVKIVNTANIAFHSRYIHDVGPLLLEMLKEIIPEPRKRSEKWFPSAVAEYDYDSYLGRYNSAQYHHHNFLNTVLFNQVLKKVPKNAILIEIAPRGLLQAIFKRSLQSNVERVVLSRRDEEDNIEFLLSNIGTIYLSEEHRVSLKRLYPEPKFPVDSGVPTISSLIGWDHSTKWYVPYYEHNLYDGQKIMFDLKKTNNKFLFDYTVNGLNIFPRMGYVFLVWKALANINMLEVSNFPVRFEDIKFIKTVVIPDSDHIEFSVNILKSGWYEVWYDHSIVSTGQIFSLNKTFVKNSSEFSADLGHLKLNKDEFYNELHLRGYNVNGVYKSVVECDIFGKNGEIQFTENWIVFLENIFQIFIVGQHTQLVTVSNIGKIFITPEYFFNGNQHVNYAYDPVEEVVNCGVVKIEEIDVMALNQRQSTKQHTLLKYAFVQNGERYTNDEEESHLEHSLRISLKIVIENNLKSLVTNVTEYVPNYTSRKLSIATRYYNAIVKVVPQKHLNHIRYAKIGNLSHFDSNINFLLVPYSEANTHLASILSMLKETSFLFTKVKNCSISETLKKFIEENVVFKCFDENYTYILIKKTSGVPDSYHIIEASNVNFSWIEKLQDYLTGTDDKVYLINKGIDTGIIGLFNCLREELVASNLRLFVVQQDEKLDFHSDFYKNQIKKDLAVNVLTKNTWGTYRVLRVLNNSKKNVLSWEINLNGEIFEQNPFISHSIKLLYASPFKWSYSHQSYHGFEFCGIDSLGRKVIGMNPRGNSSSYCDDSFPLILQLPSSYNEEQATSIPGAYALAYYSLFIKADLRTTQNLIVFGTTNVCLASIILALDQRSNVLVVTKNRKETIQLLKIFPKFKPEHIFDCQQENVTTKILSKVNNNNLEVVVYEDETFLQQSRFLKLIKTKCKVINLSMQDQEISSKTVNQLFSKKCQIIGTRLKDLFIEDSTTLDGIRLSIQKYIDQRVIIPLNYETTNIYDLETITSHLQTSEENPKKLLIKISGFDKLMCEKANPYAYFSEKKSYIVLERYGGLALKLTKFLINRGAKNIILNTLGEESPAYQAYCLNIWKNRGINVLKTSFNTSNYNETEAIVKFAESTAPLGGIFTFAVDIENKQFIDLTAGGFKNSINAKLHSAQYLDMVSRRCPQLDYFVIFSSTASLGCPGQSTCAYADSALENVCRRRKNDNFPALAIKWAVKANESCFEFDSFDVMDEFLQRPHPEIVLLNSDVFEEQAVDIDEKETDVVKMIINILGIKNWEQLDDSTTLQKLGVDSISYVDIKHTLLEQLGVNLGATEIRKLTIKDLENFDKGRMLGLVEQ